MALRPTVGGYLNIDMSMVIGGLAGFCGGYKTCLAAHFGANQDLYSKPNPIFRMGLVRQKRRAGHFGKTSERRGASTERRPS